MKTIFTQFSKRCWLTLLLLGVSIGLYAKPTWTFRVVVAVEKQTAEFYQTMLAKPIDQIVRDQMATVNANFNRSPNFNGIYNFEIDSIYVFSGPAQTEVFRLHPNYQYSVVIDGKFTEPTVGGGWYGGYQTIYHSWPWSPNFASGPFGPGATDGLTHEFGHARGAVDIYGTRVEGSKNPVNGQTFEPVNSIMNYPYGNIVWDEYTTHLLNSTADGPIVGDQWIIKPFPGVINLKVVDAQGMPLEGASLEMYPVAWFSTSVSPTPLLQYTTFSNGQYLFPTNPFQPSTSGYPWTMRYANFLIKATYHSAVVYKWMPLYEVQNAYFQNGANSVYNAVIQFPAETPVIRISSLNTSSFRSNDPITVSFSTEGAFEQGNTFSLHLIDEGKNTFILQTVAGTAGATLTGVLPMITSTQVLKVRIVSSKPVVQSSDYGIVIKPAQLTLLTPNYNCQSGEIQFNWTGGDGSPITYEAPGIKRSSPTDNFGVVEQELRNDPKTMRITASQSNSSVVYTFDLKAACSNTVTPKPPVLLSPIPDQHFVLNQPLPGSGFAVGLFFADPTPYIPNYSSGWNFQVDGLPAGLYVFTKPVIGSGSPVRIIMGTPNSPGVYTVTIKASTAAFPDKPVITSFKIIITDSNPATAFSLTQPTYDCQTGVITFKTNGSDGSAITFSAPGIIRSSITSNTGTVEQELRNDPKPITITATQSGQTVSYTFDFGAYCANPQPPLPPQPPVGGALALLAPTYNCSTGAITFTTSGGDGTPIEFMAAGITGWTSNPNQFVDQESRTAGDVQPFTLLARQSGRVITYGWDLKAACGRARVGTREKPTAVLTLTVLGNPVHEHLRVLIQGAADQSLQLRLSDFQGRLVESRTIEPAGKEEVQNFHVNQTQPGIFLLQALTPTQHKSVKIIKN